MCYGLRPRHLNRSTRAPPYQTVVAHPSYRTVFNVVGLSNRFLCMESYQTVLRTREYDFKSFIKRIVSGPTLGRLHNTMGIYIHGSGHKLSMWYNVVPGHSAESLLVLITLRGRRFEPFARRQRISLLAKGITTTRAAVIYTRWMRTGQIQLRNNHLR